MKRILFLLLWLPLLAHAACCTIINSGSKTDPGTLNNSSNYTTTAMTNAMNAGDAVLIGYGNDNTNPNNLGLPTLSSGDLCTRRFSLYDTGQAHGVAGYTCVLASGVSANTLTITVNKSTQTSSVEMTYTVIRGWNGTTVLDGATVTASTSGTNATVAMTPTSIAADFLFAVYGGRDTTFVTLNSPQSGWTAGPGANDTTGLTQVGSAYQVTSSAGSYTAGWPAITNVSSKTVLVGAMAIAGPSGSGALNLSILRVN